MQRRARNLTLIKHNDFRQNCHNLKVCLIPALLISSSVHLPPAILISSQIIFLTLFNYHLELISVQLLNLNLHRDYHCN